ncbi:hypothetical protein P7L66_04440 (plasmid) [Tistrella mobilis]
MNTIVEDKGIETMAAAAARPAWRSPKLDMLDAAETLAGSDGTTDGGIFS